MKIFFKGTVPVTRGVEFVSAEKLKRWGGRWRIDYLANERKGQVVIDIPTQAILRADQIPEELDAAFRQVLDQIIHIINAGS